MGATVADYETYFKTYWTEKLGGTDNFNKALQDGVVEPASCGRHCCIQRNAKLAETTAKASAAAAGGATEVVLYQKYLLVTAARLTTHGYRNYQTPLKVTWDNYVMMGTEMYKEDLW